MELIVHQMFKVYKFNKQTQNANKKMRQNRKIKTLTNNNYLKPVIHQNLLNNLIFPNEILGQ